MISLNSQKSRVAQRTRPAQYHAAAFMIVLIYRYETKIMRKAVTSKVILRNIRRQYMIYLGRLFLELVANRSQTRPMRNVLSSGQAEEMPKKIVTRMRMKNLNVSTAQELEKSHLILMQRARSLREQPITHPIVNRYSQFSHMKTKPTIAYEPAIASISPIPQTTGTLNSDIIRHLSLCLCRRAQKLSLSDRNAATRGGMSNRSWVAIRNTLSEAETQKQVSRMVAQRQKQRRAPMLRASSIIADYNYCYF